MQSAKRPSCTRLCVRATGATLFALMPQTYVTLRDSDMMSACLYGEMGER